SRILITLLYLLPICQTVPFLKYTLIRYYPIHIVAIYLTFALATLAVTTLLQDATTDETAVRSGNVSNYTRGSEVQ
ncbi:MAG: hypothetical protein EBU84_11430, partial [Actinobacteria bacterium]|nr:hypothetical protein [Actinomycetota bacterium]